MPYYPKSQVTTNLYTSDGSFIVASTGEFYVGPYWTTSTGKSYTGATPQTPNTELLIPQTPSTTVPEQPQTPNRQTPPTNVYFTDDESEYPNLPQDVQAPLKKLPTGTITKPTDNDYKIGEFTRFFCKKINEIKYLEIDPTTYSMLLNKDSSILWQMYIAYAMPWTLTGDKETVFRTNKNITELTILRNKLPGFAQFLKNDYLKYYKG